MTYRTNFEPYSNRSLDISKPRTSEEVLYPLLDLYPHVAALQLQAHSGASSPTSAKFDFSGYHNVGYWADAYPAQYLDENSRPSTSRPSTHRISETKPAGRLVSKLRRFLGRDDMRRRVNSPN